jgi:hypothetical protein
VSTETTQQRTGGPDPGATELPGKPDAPQLVRTDWAVFGISAIVSLAKRLLPRCLVLRHPQPHVANVLEVVDIASLGIRIEVSPPGGSAEM